MNIISAMHSSTTPKATLRLTLISPPSLAKYGLKIMHVATPKRASAISEPIASAVSRPLNHFTIPRDTVMPAISQPQPKIMKPQAASLAEAGIPAQKGRIVPMMGSSPSQFRFAVNHCSRLLPMKASLMA